MALPLFDVLETERAVSRSQGSHSGNLYHQTLGRHAPMLVRTGLVLLIGSVVAVGLSAIVPWQLAALAGWDCAAVAFLAAVWPLVLRASADETRRMATRQDDSRTVGVLLLLGVCIASLIGGGFALDLAGHRVGAMRLLLILMAAGTVILSWLVLNTVYTLRYADLYYSSATGHGVDFVGGTAPASYGADYRDFAYLAFTIGMTYQVSDTTLRNRTFRRTVLRHALLGYLFGVVIVAGAINLIASLLH